MASSQIERIRHAQRASRARYGEIIAKREHTLYSSAAAAAIGVAEARGHKLPVIMGWDGTITVGVAALVGANMVNSGSGQRMLQSLADAMLAIGSYKLGVANGAKDLVAPAMKGVGDAAAMDALLSSS
jgi:uncharacterized protein (DUF2062 family)